MDSNLFFYCYTYSRKSNGTKVSLLLVRLNCLEVFMQNWKVIVVSVEHGCVFMTHRFALGQFEGSFQFLECLCKTEQRTGRNETKEFTSTGSAAFKLLQIRSVLEFYCHFKNKTMKI